MSRIIALNRRLVLEARVDVPDGAGGRTATWAPRGTLWASVQALSGRETFEAALARPRVRYRVLVRAAAPGAPTRPRPDQRLREGDRVFDILTVAEHGDGSRYLELQAEEGATP